MIRMPGCDREPGGHGIGGAHREDIDDAAPLQVHEDRAEMLLALLPGPVIDAHDTQASRRRRVAGRRV